MDFRNRTWLAMLAMALAGCGSKDEPASSGAATGGTETASVAPAVDLNDPRELDSFLKGSGVENAPIAGEPANRGVEKFPNAIFPIYPTGKVRAEGLNSFRIDIDIENFKDGGSLEFHAGKAVLWKQGGVFAPTSRVLTGAMPKTVADGVKVGETVTWGVFYDDPKIKDVVQEFRVVQEDQVTKLLAQLEKNKKVSSQSPLVRTLAKAKTLQNHSLCSEALASFLAIVETHPSISDAWKNIVECMRRLDLKKTPLFEEALLQMSNGGNVNRPVNPPFGDLGKGGGVKPADTPLNPLAGNTPAPNYGPGGADIPPAGTPPAAPVNGQPPAMDGDAPLGPGGGQTAAGALARVTEFARQQGALADSAAAEAAATQRAAAEADRAVEAAKRAVHEAERAGRAAQGGTPSEQRAAQAALLLATQQLAAAQAAADGANALAQDAARNAESARYSADQAERVRADLARLAAVGGAGPTPQLPPTAPDPRAAAAAATRLRAIADSAQANATALRLAVVDATAAYHQAKAQAEAHPHSQFWNNQLNQADLALQAARAAAEAAQAAADRAAAEATAAESGPVQPH